MINIVEAGGDVPFDHPLIAAAGQLVDTSMCVKSFWWSFPVVAARSWVVR
jgi:hypothetical protein